MKEEALKKLENFSLNFFMALIQWKLLIIFHVEQGQKTTQCNEV